MVDRVAGLGSVGVLEEGSACVTIGAAQRMHEGKTHANPGYVTFGAVRNGRYRTYWSVPYVPVGAVRNGRYGTARYWPHL